VYAKANVSERLQIFLDAYGLAAVDRGSFAQVLDKRRRAGERFTRRRMTRQETAFIEKRGTPEAGRRFAVEREWVGAVPTGIATHHGSGPISHGDHDYLLS
jgi:hypothetical protein